MLQKVVKLAIVDEERQFLAANFLSNAMFLRAKWAENFDD